MARRVKSLKNNSKGISIHHREHRSKRGRKKFNGRDPSWKGYELRQKREEMRLKEREEELHHGN